MKKLLLVLLLVGGCVNPTYTLAPLTRSSACAQVIQPWNIGVITGEIAYPCEFTETCPYDDGTWQSSCWAMDEGCEKPCDRAQVQECTDALRFAIDNATETDTSTCDAFHLAFAIACTSSTACGAP